MAAVAVLAMTFSGLSAAEAAATPKLLIEPRTGPIVWVDTSPMGIGVYEPGVHVSARFHNCPGPGDYGSGITLVQDGITYYWLNAPKGAGYFDCQTAGQDFRLGQLLGGAGIHPGRAYVTVWVWITTGGTEVARAARQVTIPKTHDR